MRVKQNSFGGYKVPAIEEHVAVMHDKALELGYSSNMLPPNWMTTNKTPNWFWYRLATTPPWLTAKTVDEVCKQTLAEQLAINPQLKEAYDGDKVIITGLGAEIDEHETMHYRLLMLRLKYPSFNSFDRLDFLNSISMLYRVAGQSATPYFYHLSYNMDLVSPWAVA